MRVDLVLMVAVVTERVEDLRWREVRQMLGNFFRRDALPPQFDNGANRRARPLMIGSPLRIWSSVIMYRCSVAVVMLLIVTSFARAQKCKD